jgi:hypothetical protein
LRKLIGILLITASLTACNNKYKASSENRADSLKMIKDSLILDSFKRAETAKLETNNKQQTSGTKETIVYKNSTVTAPEKSISSAAKGAIIGGVDGAAGYLIGRDKDKKTGRLQ